MTWRGIGPSGYFATIDINGGSASFKYEPPRGDASGVVDNLIVIGLRGRPISNAIPVFGNVLTFKNGQWTPSAPSGVSGGSGNSPHKLLSSLHIDTTPADPFAGDLIVGSGGPATWTRLPIGLNRQSLRASNVGQPVWAYDPVQIISSGNIVNLTVDNHKVIVNKTIGSTTTINLPNSPFLGQEILVKDGKGDSNTNKITVLASGTTIDGLNNIQIKSKYQSIHFMYNGTEWNII